MSENVDAGTVRVSVILDTSQVKTAANGLKQEMKGVKDSTNSTKDAFGLLGGRFGAMGRQATQLKESIGGLKTSFNAAIAGAGGLKAAIVSLASAMLPLIAMMAALIALQKTFAFMSSSVNEAADAQKTRKYFSAVFGESTAYAQKKVEELARAYKVATGDIMKDTAQLAQYYRSAGIEAGAAADMSLRLVQMSKDLAATNASISSEQAMSAMTGIARGQTKALKNLGIVMTEAEVKQFALQKGILKSGEVFGTAAKQQALYQIALEKLGNTQGNYQKNANTLDNANAQLNASTSNLKETIGDLLLPAVVALKRGFAVLVNAISTALKFFIDMGKTIIGFVKTALQPLFDVIGKIVSAFGFLIHTIKGFFGMNKEEVQQAAESVGEATDDMASDTEEMAERMEEAIGLAGFDKLTTLTTADMGEGMDDLGESVFYAGEGMADLVVETNLFESSLRSVARALRLDAAWAVLKKAGEEAWASIKDAAGGAWMKISEFANNFVISLFSAFSALGDFIKGMFSMLYEGIKNMLSNIWGAIKDIAGGIWGGITGLAGDIWGGVTDFGGSVKNFFGLADGGVAMPGKPGLVMVGDNMTEPEIVAPQSYIVDAVAAAIGKAGISGGTFEQSSNVNITLELDGAVLARKSMRYNMREQTRQNGGRISL